MILVSSSVLIYVKLSPLPNGIHSTYYIAFEKYRISAFIKRMFMQ